MDRFLREGALTRHPLQGSQHAYQGGKSTKTGLHSLVTKIECSIQKKQFSLAVFMDIQGTFDSTTFAAIQEALESHGVGKTVKMLKCRNIQLTYQGESVEARVVKGCPQGGVLSPPLWCMDIDSLLLKQNALRYTAQAYADDLVIVIHGKHLNTVADLMQRSLRVVNSWCKTKGLSVNPDKTEVLLFTRKRNRVAK